jgi:hypothetical protein
LKKKAAKAKSDTKTKIEERIAEIKNDQRMVDDAFNEFNRMLQGEV